MFRANFSLPYRLTHVKFIDLGSQQQFILNDGRTLRESIDGRIKSLLDHGQYILGPEVQLLEERLAKYVGVKHCVAVSSGTDALLIALMALGVGPGDEVITTPFSFVATTETIALLGAKPVYADIDPATYNLEPSNLESLISSKTKVILPVSLYGQPADFSRINTIANNYGLPVIEDGAQSFGSTHCGRRSGSLTTIGTTSFFPSKPLGGYGDGGACFTDDSEIANKIRLISRHGQSKRYYHTEVGVNGRIDTIQAAILLSKLDIFDYEVKLRNEVAERYTSALKNNMNVSTPVILDCNTSVYAQYTIKVDDRDLVRDSLNQQNIPSAVHYPTLLCQQPAFSCAHLRCDNKSSCQMHVADALARHVLSIPMHPYLTSEDQDKIVTALSAI